MPPFFALRPPGDTGREHATGLVTWTGEVQNVNEPHDGGGQPAPEPVEQSHFMARPARTNVVVTFAPHGLTGAWCRDHFHGVRMRHVKLTAVPRGAMLPDRNRANVRRPNSIAYGSLVERVAGIYGYTR